MITPNPILGVLLHAIGATAAAFCYTPQKVRATGPGRPSGWPRHRSAGSRLPINFGLALLTGCLWYGQFFFYGLGHGSYIGESVAGH